MYRKVTKVALTDSQSRCRHHVLIFPVGLTISSTLKIFVAVKILQLSLACANDPKIVLPCLISIITRGLTAVFNLTIARHGRKTVPASLTTGFWLIVKHSCHPVATIAALCLMEWGALHSTLWIINHSPSCTVVIFAPLASGDAYNHVGSLRAQCGPKAFSTLLEVDLK